MADETKPAAEPVKPYVFDAVAFDKKVTDLQAAVDAVKGKPNYNPYKFLQDNGFDDLIQKYKLGERSRELFDAMQQIPSTIPVLNPNYVPPVPYKPELPKQLRPPGK